MRTFFIHFCCAVLAAILCSCDRTAVPYTFYYWKTSLRLSPTESEALQKATDQTLYLRIMDIDMQESKISALGRLQVRQKLPATVRIAPVFYITNRVFLQKKNTREIVRLVLDETRRYEQRLGTTFGNEIQIDCDWTSGTREAYFSFLRQLKTVSKKQLSSTLRLHQVKDKGLMGVPPVDKAYLMCYSTSSPLENQGINSILHLPLLKNYLANLRDYPIQNMAVALPLYSWAIVTNHLGRHRLINAVTKQDLQRDGMEMLADGQARVSRDGFYFGQYLSKGFIIRVEEISAEDLDAAKKFVETQIKVRGYVYYHLDERFLRGRTF